MKTDQITMTLLFDEYGALLTEKQQTCCDLHWNQDLSLAEIAEELGISRQGVHDALTRAEATLQQTEQALGNVARARRQRTAVEEIRRCTQALDGCGDGQVRALAAQIEAALGGMN